MSLRKPLPKELLRLIEKRLDEMGSPARHGQDFLFDGADDRVTVTMPGAHFLPDRAHRLNVPYGPTPSKAAAMRRLADAYAFQIDCIHRGTEILARRDDLIMTCREICDRGKMSLVETSIKELWFFNTGGEIQLSVVRVRVEVEMIGDGYRTERRAYVLEDGKGRCSEIAAILREARRQEERRRAVADGRDQLIADPVMKACLDGMPVDRSKALYRFLRSHPDPRRSGGSYYDISWSAKTLGQKGVPLPNEIESIRIRNGRIVGRVRIGSETTWTNDTVKHRRTSLPETVLASLSGQPLKAIVDHPRLPVQSPILEIRTDATGTLRIKVDVPVRPVVETATESE